MLRDEMEQFSKLYNLPFEFVEDLAEIIIEIDQLEQKADSKEEFERLTYLLSLFKEDYYQNWIDHLDKQIKEGKDNMFAF